MFACPWFAWLDVIAPMHPVLELAKVYKVNEGLPACHRRNVSIVFLVKRTVKAIGTDRCLFEDCRCPELPQLLDDGSPLQVSRSLQPPACVFMPAPSVTHSCHTFTRSATRSHALAPCQTMYPVPSCVGTAGTH